ncbi:MAG TPA: hypothetical protein VHN59_03200 [Chitinophagaceae bacterium]|nr:hypothetical protein [Chitinophagaceae bacterium]
MKTTNLILTTWLKAFRPFTGDSIPAKHSIIVKKSTAVKQQAKEDKDTSKKEFQRKAHIGNFFAGAHCVFDPRLIR